MPFNALNTLRRERGLMTIDEIMALISAGNAILDPFSTLISSGVTLGSGNTLYPCVSLLCADGMQLAMGNGNIFHSNTLIEASMGPVIIGNGNQFGEGGFTAKANRAGAAISIGDTGRYLNGAAVFGETTLGTGSQLLGAVTVDDCHLAPGGSFREPDPDLRAGLLKGSGVARNLTVPAGHVIVGTGAFALEALERQSLHHPKPEARALAKL